MDEATRRRLALLVLAASGAALIATSQMPGTTVTLDGEVVVGPEYPGSFAARFEVGRPPGGSLQSLRLDVSAPRGTDRRLAADSTATVRDVTVTDHQGSLDIPPSACAGGCTVDLRSTVRWVGLSEPTLSVRWSATLNAVGGEYSEVPVAASVLEGKSPGISPLGWLLVGGLLAGASGVVWLLAGGRYRRVRLGLAATGVVLPTAGVAFLAIGEASTGNVTVLGILMGLATAALPYFVLAVGIALALRAHLRGNPTWLPIMGVLYVMLIGPALAVITEGMSTYRPYEVTLLGLLAGTPAAAALTSAPLVTSRQGRRITARGLVYASQILLLVGYALVAIPLLPLVLLSIPLVLIERQPQILLNALFEAVPLVVLILLVLGLRAWQAGRRSLLLVANVLALPPLLLVTVAGGLLGGLIGGLGLLFAIPAGVLAAAALIGVVGGLLVSPPAGTRGSAAPVASAPSGSDSDEHAGKGEEIGGVDHEGDGLDAGDRG